jgi:acyl-CoA synthetase (AMP-forming)/AMP-acid ligase II
MAPGGWWNGLTLASLLSSTPDRADLVVGPGSALSTEALRLRVRSLAGWLRSRGVERGDAVAWQLPNDPDVVSLYLACWWLGAVAVPFHHGLTSIEAAHVLERVGTAPVLLASEGSPVAALSQSTVVPELHPLLELSSDPVETYDAQPADAAAILTTSGSTGTPKCVIHSQRSLAHKARQLSLLHGTTTADAVLVPVPLAHMAGLVHGVLHPIGTGVKAVITRKWDPDDALEILTRERVTMLFGPPIFSLGIAAATAFSRENVQSVRLIASGSTAISESYVQRTREAFGAVVKRTYGSTEAPIVCNTFPDDPPELGWTTDGRAAPGVELEVRDTATGAVLGSDAIGELWVRGPELCDGYLEEEDTADVFIDGWMRTRDLASIDQDGFVRIAGRISSFVIRGGMNISTIEVESVLSAHPMIDQTVVLGSPDELYGERIVAFVVARGPIDRDECARWFAETGASKYKLPDRVIQLDEMPLLPALQKPDLTALHKLL